MSPVQKASVASTTHLIQTGESVIAEERLAWQSTAGREGHKHSSSDSDETAGGLHTPADDADKSKVRPLQ